MKNEPLKIPERVLRILPSEERRKKGPYAIFECFQQIPCNPCYTACRFGAVKELKDINELPETFYDKCVGCGACVAHCSGLAAFIVDETYSETQTVVKFAWEFLPLPAKGDVVDAADRDGQVVTKGTVVSVAVYKDRTSVVGIAVDDKWAHIVRGMALPLTRENGVFGGEPENVRLDENHLSLNDLKLEARFTMGPCQGKTCTALLVRELSARLGKPAEEIRGPRHRQPLRPVKLGEFAGYREL